MKEKKTRTYFNIFVTSAETSASYVKRYRKIYIAITLVIALFEIIMAIRGAFVFNFSRPKHLAYFICYIVLLLSSLFVAFFLFRGIKKDQSSTAINLVINIYSAILLSWSVVMSVLDMIGSGYPIIFLTILIVLASIVPLNPFFFIPFSFAATAALIASDIIFGTAKTLQTSDYINIFVFIVMSFLVAYRNYRVTMNEEKNKKELTRLSKVDVLTGLGNENSYYTFLNDLTKIDQDKIQYAVMVFDLNGLKATDDTYGHRFGAFLISEIGRRLPTIFTKSALFHTGGDEFVVVIISQFNELDELVRQVDEQLAYDTVTYEGVDLMLSVARGVARHEAGETYNDTYQRADRDMYVNKKEVKEKYGIKGR